MTRRPHSLRAIPGPFQHEGMAFEGHVVYEQRTAHWYGATYEYGAVYAQAAAYEQGVVCDGTRPHDHAGPETGTNSALAGGPTRTGGPARAGGSSRLGGFFRGGGFSRAGAVLVAAVLVATGGCAAGKARTATGAADPAATCGPSTMTVAGEAIDPIKPAPKSELPVTIRSADGTTVKVKDTRRILALNLYGSLAEIVFSLGLGGSVVGRDASTTFPEARRLPLVTNQGHDLSAEAILKLNPTVVIADKSIGPPEALTQLRSSGIPVVMVDDQQTLPAVGEHITAIAQALGVPEAGKKLNARVTSRIEAARATAPKQRTPLRVAFLYLRGTSGAYLMGGKGAGSDAMIQAIGAKDAGTVAGLSGFRPLTSEGLINAAPDVILVMSAGLKSVGGVSGLLKLPGIAQTPAGQRRRVVDADDGTLLNFGARTGETIKALATAVYRPCGPR